MFSYVLKGVLFHDTRSEWAGDRQSRGSMPLEWHADVFCPKKKRLSRFLPISMWWHVPFVALLCLAGLPAVAGVGSERLLEQLAGLSLSAAQMQGVVSAVQGELRRKDVQAKRSRSEVQECLKKTQNTRALLRSLRSWRRQALAPTGANPSLQTILAPRGPTAKVSSPQKAGQRELVHAKVITLHHIQRVSSLFRFFLSFSLLLSYSLRSLCFAVTYNRILIHTGGAGEI